MSYDETTWEEDMQKANARIAELEQRLAIYEKDGFGVVPVNGGRCVEVYQDGEMVELETSEAGDEVVRLRQRVEELEAPPIVPAGWELRKIGAPEWRKWEALHNGKLTSWCGHGDDLPIVRALAWAIEHDERPPHEGDEP